MQVLVGTFASSSRACVASARKDAVAIMLEMSQRGMVGEGMDKLLPGSLRCGWVVTWNETALAASLTHRLTAGIVRENY
jgi:hypothetical protein